MQLVARDPITILNGASLSASIKIRGGLVSIIETPAAWTAANLTFQTSGDGTNFFNLYDETGVEITVVCDVSRRIRLEPSQWAANAEIKVRSGTAGVPVVQGADRVLFLEVWE